MVGDLALIRFVGPVVLHGAGPEAPADLVVRHDLLRLSRQDRQVLEAGRLKLDRTASIEKVLLPFIHEDDGAHIVLNASPSKRLLGSYVFGSNGFSGFATRRYGISSGSRR